MRIMKRGAGAAARQTPAAWMARLALWVGTMRDSFLLLIWVLGEACACKARWNQLGLGPMAINVSPLQLDAAELPLLLAGCLARYQLRPGEIQLEITESQAIPLHQRVDRNHAAVGGMGVTLAMDDFGTGYSSLLHMRRFQIHAIKLDGSLAREVLVNRASRDIIHTVAAFGQARRVDVVAEFVETAAQRDALAVLGCDTFQGYLYSAPLPADECAHYLLAAGTPAQAVVAPAAAGAARCAPAFG